MSVPTPGLPRRAVRGLKRRLPPGLKRRVRALRPGRPAAPAAATLPPPPPPPPPPPAPEPPAPAPAPVAAPRTIDDLETLHEFWRQPAPDGNVPSNYVGTIGRSEVLLQLISDVPKDARILEVGCNVGRNLAYLVDHGYRNVEGIEISPHAVELLRKTYPQLSEVTVHLGAAEDVLPKLADDSFELVFTMAVIEHIHPSSTAVFDDMVRIGKSLLTIEPPGRTSHRQFPHDVPAIFTERGLHMVSSKAMSSFPQTANDRGIAIFSAYRFQRPN